MYDRFKYLLSSAIKGVRGVGSACPSCGSGATKLVSRKYVATALRRCQSCRLMFRTPADTVEEVLSYYQDEYSSGFTTTLPGEEELATMLKSGFANTPKDFSRYVRIMRALGVPNGARVLDFGSSWGYGVWQFEQAGYQAYGFELSTKRARFAREKLGVNVVSDIDRFPENLDACFSSHVLEHVPQLNDALARLFSALCSGGLMIAITPNGSQHYRQKRPGAWQRSWGLKHPLVLDADYWQSVLGARQYILTSDLGEEAAMRQWAEQGGCRLGTLDRWELLVAARK